MTKIMFVCLGNICRSPMAELIFKKIIKDMGKEDKFYVESSATSYEEIGNPIYPPAVKKLSEYGISAKGKTAKHLEQSDYEKFDYIIGMEERNIRAIKRIFKTESDNKIYKLLDFAGGGDIADPWYTNDFQKTYDDILKGCAGLLNYIKNK